jgi:hypothetical protein
MIAAALSQVHQLRRDALDPPLSLPGEMYMSEYPTVDWDERWPRLAGTQDGWRARDGGYLTRRYTERPDKRYSFLNCGWTDALAVVEMGPHTAHLMELLAPPGEAATIGRLALAAEYVAAQAGAIEIEAWFPAWTEVAQILCAGCRYRGEPGPRLRKIPAEDSNPEVADLRESSYYSMGDWRVH